MLHFCCALKPLYKLSLRRWAIITLIVLCLVPLIIYDSMGYADYFKLNSGVTLDDNKMLRFVFGWIYFLSRISTRGFLPWNLFCGMGCLTTGTATDTFLSTMPAVLYMLAAVYMYAGTVTAFILSLLPKNMNPVFQKKLAKGIAIGFIASGVVFLLALAVLTAKLGTSTFKMDDFLAYGAVKYISELILSVILAIHLWKLQAEWKKEN